MLAQTGDSESDLAVPKSFLEHQSMFDASCPSGWWY
jgi:hypothetical protein